MSDAFAEFEKRLDSLERKHRDLANGYVAKINPDGLIVIAPKSRSSGNKLRLMSAIFLGFIVFKITTIVLVGPAVYDSRLDELRAGTGPEQMSAWLMQADPFSAAAADFIITSLP